MRKNLLVIAIVIFFTNAMNAQAPAWVWSKSVSARLDNQSKVCASKDAAGGIIVSGQFDSNAPFGASNLAVVGTIDLYATKYDQSGTPQWAKGFGGISNIMFPGGSAIDAAGNIYLAGAYSFGMDINGVNYYSAGDKDGYIIKLSPNGGVIWVKTYGAAAAQEFNSIAVSGNKIYVAGSYMGSFSTGSVNLPASNNGSADAMVLALDTAGNALWAATGGGADQDYIYSVAASSSEVYVSGTVRGASATFGTTNLTGSGSADDILVARVNATTGNFDLAKRFGSNSTDQGTCVGYDSYGNIYVAGNFLGAINFGNGSSSITSNGMNTYSDGFLAKLNSQGWGLWACRQGGASDDVVTGMEVGINGYIYLCGYYSNGQGTLTSTTTSVTLASMGGADGFAAKYNPNGGILWGIKFGNTSDDRPKAIISDNNGYCYVMGNFFGSITLGSLTAVNSLPTNIGTYIGRLNGFTTGLQEVKATYNFLMYPNPTTGQVNIELPEGKYMEEVEVYSLNGQRVHHAQLNLPVRSTSLDLAGLSTGIYQVKVLTPDGYANKAIEIK
ncbi:MAG: T9SS type A sorting domain-containing protein [Bacteroidota bacterium]